MVPGQGRVTAVLAGALRDPAVSPDWSGADVSALIDTARRHRVDLLLGWMLRAAGALDDWPKAFVDDFQRVERQALYVDCVRHAELASVLRTLDGVGVRALLFKGAALAYTHYPAPHVRPRADTDLLVPAEELHALEAVIGRLGYVRPAETAGDLVSYQSHYQKTDRHGVTHALDVHWKISNFQALANRFTHGELWDRRVGVDGLGPAAAAVDATHALLLALVHRAGHHPGSTNLLWLYDFHLLNRSLTAAQMRQVHDVADARGLTDIAAEGLTLASHWFGDTSGDPAPAVQQPWTQAQVLHLDLRALPDWPTRVRLIREHVLPSANYMRAKYGVRSNAMLPALYVWRVVHGLPKWLRRPTADD